MNWPLALTTVTAPWLALAELAPRCAAAGLAGLELVVRDQAFDPGRPYDCWSNNAALLPRAGLTAAAQAAAALLQTHGLRCPVLSSYALPSDHSDARTLAGAAVILGARQVRMWGPTPRPGQIRSQLEEARSAWRELARIAADTPVRFVLELHNDSLAGSASAALRLLEHLDPTCVGVILDIANTASVGNEPLALAVELLGPYLAHVHVKDVAVAAGPAWNGQQCDIVALGQGSMRWPECLRILRQAGYQGWLSLENFTGIEQGPARIATDTAWLRSMISESEHASHT